MSFELCNAPTPATFRRIINQDISDLKYHVSTWIAARQDSKRTCYGELYSQIEVTSRETVREKRHSAEVFFAHLARIKNRLMTDVMSEIKEGSEKFNGPSAMREAGEIQIRASRFLD